MKLNQDVFRINAAVVSRKIEDFIRDRMKAFRRKGIVVPVSGGLDSTTVLALCVRAVGRKKVTGLLLPERKGNPDAEPYAKLAAQRFGVKTVTIDISPALKALGVYRFITNAIPGRKLAGRLVRLFLKLVKSNPYIDKMRGDVNILADRGVASIYAKQRVRLVALYKYAEARQLMVAGSAHLSEDLVGLYVKFGVDDNADIMPLKNLFRSQILQVARHVGVPDQITGRSPNPDVMPGIEDKYADMMGISSEQTDLVLYGLTRGMKIPDIAKQTGISPAKVKEIREVIELTDHMRRPSQAPDLGKI